MTRAVVVFVAGIIVFAFGVQQLLRMRDQLASPVPIAAKQLPPAPERATRASVPRVWVQVTVHGLSYVFSPARLTVHAGTTVTWENRTAAGHTVTSVVPRLFNKSFGGHEDASVTFDHPGTYAYYCAFHPYMLGTVVVLP